LEVKMQGNGFKQLTGNFKGLKKQALWESYGRIV